MKITAFVKPDPNAPTATNSNGALPLPVINSAAQKPKSSTQPGHEGHNHD